MKILQLFTTVVIVNIFLFNGYLFFIFWILCMCNYRKFLQWNLFSFISWFFEIEPKKINYCVIILILKYNRDLIIYFINNINSKTDFNPSFEYHQSNLEKRKKWNNLIIHTIFILIYLYIYIIFIKWNFLHLLRNLKFYFLILFIIVNNYF